LSDFEGPTHQRDIDATRATARLPGLDVEIVHRRSPAGDAGQLSINLQAMPSLEAFGRIVDAVAGRVDVVVVAASVEELP
jgi:hypothetical protein